MPSWGYISKLGFQYLSQEGCVLANTRNLLYIFTIIIKYADNNDNNNDDDDDNNNNNNNKQHNNTQQQLDKTTTAAASNYNYYNNEDNQPTNNNRTRKQRHVAYFVAWSVREGNFLCKRVKAYCVLCKACENESFSLFLHRMQRIYSLA